MDIDNLFLSTPAFNEAIDSNPLLVNPEMLVVEAIRLMSRVRGQSCVMPSFDQSKIDIDLETSRSSCVLVMEAGELIGIFTERDIVRLTAMGESLNGLTLAEVMVKPVITLKEDLFKDIFAALFLFRRYHIRHLPILSEGNELRGVVSPESIRKVLRPANLLKMRRVADVMTRQVIHAPPTESVLNIAKLMASKKVSCIVIVEENQNDGFKPVGIITERDIVQFHSLELELSIIQAQTVMSTPLFLLNPEDSLLMAHQEMERRHVRRLVVSWNWGKGLGLVTQTNLLKIFDPMEMYSVIEMLQHTIEELTLKAGQIDNLSHHSNDQLTLTEEKLDNSRHDSKNGHFLGINSSV